MFDPQNFYPPKNISSPKDTETPKESTTQVSLSSSMESSSPIRMPPKRSATLQQPAITRCYPGTDAGIASSPVRAQAASIENIR
ncbi:hypothetical protein Tco_1294539 [Tanacetum coccineum]